MQDILINVGYDDISQPNLYDYNIEPDWNLISKTNITTLLGNQLGNFKSNSIKYYIDNNINFIYPIVLFDNKLFENHNTIDFDKELTLYYSINLRFI
jgi:hypothetical protein